jgi:hypothetical protein
MDAVSTVNNANLPDMTAVAVSSKVQKMANDLAATQAAQLIAAIPPPPVQGHLGNSINLLA